jgi:hypothetical protein
VEQDELVLVTSLGYSKSGNRMHLIQTYLVVGPAEEPWVESVTPHVTRPRLSIKPGVQTRS